MKIYVAGKFQKKELVLEIYNKIKEMGHEVTHDWTTHLPIKPYNEHIELAKQYSQNELEGIARSDISIYISDSTGHTLHMEFGAALILKYTTGKPIIYVIGDYQDISPWLFNQHVIHKNSIEEVIEEIKKLT